MKLMSLLTFFFICLGSAGLGGFLTSFSVKTWYKTIKKPSWNPPDKIFAPVWTTLFLMMAVAGWMVWERLPKSGDYGPIILFGIQLVLNIGWSALFFTLRRPDLALLEIIFLWIFIMLTAISFWSVYWIAGALFVPYLLWVSFAIILNFTIWQLNK